MNPCFNAVDIGKDYSHSTLIYPFRERPDAGVRVTFFLAPNGAQMLDQLHPFLLRNWDRLEGMDEPDYGTKYDKKDYYGGPLPVNTPGMPCGTPEQWQGDIDYDTWLAGGYSCDCPAPMLATYVSSVRCDDGSLIVAPATGDAELHINPAHTNDWIAEQDFKKLVHIDMSAEDPTGYVGFQVTGFIGAVIDVFQLNVNGNHLIAGNLRINGIQGNWEGAVWVRPGHNQNGVVITVPGSTTTIPLRIEKAGPSVQFQIGTNGEILTNQYTTLDASGSVVSRIAVYDETGTLLGYIPVYDTNP